MALKPVRVFRVVRGQTVWVSAPRHQQGFGSAQNNL